MLQASRWRMAGIMASLVGLAPAGHAEMSAPEPVSMRTASPEDIVVTAPPEASAAELDRQARAISRVNGSVLHEPLARFRAPVCPGIVGLPRELAELVVDRIRFNADRIGIRVAKENGCEPNILVAFTENGQEEVEALTRFPGGALSELSAADRKALIADPGPVHAWTNDVVRSRHGDDLYGERNLVDVPSLNVANSHSHIFLAHRIDIMSAVVIVDVAAIDGLSTNQIAYYVTMRSFARTRPIQGDTAADTILSLFDPGGSRPPGLTIFDLAYLRALYNSYDSLRAIATITETRRAIRRAAASGTVDDVQAD